MKGFIKIIWAIPILIFLVPGSGHAESSLYQSRLEYVTDDALQMAKNHRYEEAEKMLEQFESLFMANSEDGHLFAMDELEIVNKVHEEAMAALADHELAHDQRVERLTKFRLALDALLTDHQPLWRELEGSIMFSFEEMKQAALNQDSEGFRKSYATFMDVYSLIHPSLEVDINPESMKRLDREIIGLGEHSTSALVVDPGFNPQLAAVEKDLKQLFKGITDDEADPSIWWVIISTGSIIILTLSYVGWQKYSAETRKRKQRYLEWKN